MEKINKKALDATQLQYLATAEMLQAELIAQGFMASRIVKGEDRTDFRVIYFDGTHEYYIQRNYNNHVNVSRVDYPHYENVSPSTRGEVSKKYKGQNVNVITAEKLQAKIDAENAYHAEMESLNVQATDKVAAFIAEVKALEAQGVPVRWSHDVSYMYNKKTNENDRIQSKITGGELERNGIEFSFEISHDGYISKKIRVTYKPDSTLENFMLLSDNKYRAV